MADAFAYGDFFYSNGSSLAHFDSSWGVKTVITSTAAGLSGGVVGWDGHIYCVRMVSATPAILVYRFKSDGSSGALFATIGITGTFSTADTDVFIVRDVVTGSGYYISYAHHNSVAATQYLAQVDSAFSVLGTSSYTLEAGIRSAWGTGMALLPNGTLIYYDTKNSNSHESVAAAGAIVLDLQALSLGSAGYGNAFAACSDNSFLMVSLTSFQRKVARLTVGGAVWTTSVGTSGVNRLVGAPVFDLDLATFWITNVASGSNGAAVTALRYTLAGAATGESRTLGTTNSGLSIFMLNYTHDPVAASGGLVLGDVTTTTLEILITADDGFLYQIGNGNLISKHLAPGTSRWVITPQDGSTPLLLSFNGDNYTITAGITDAVLALPSTGSHIPFSVLTTSGLWTAGLLMPGTAPWRLHRLESKQRAEEQA